MDKPLILNNKNASDTQADAESKPQPDQATAVSAGSPPDLGTASIGAYGSAANPTVELSQKAWEDSKRYQAWNENPEGRMAIRLFSRGVLGAAFFTAGGLVAKKWMKDYNITKSLGEQNNPLKFIAKMVDTVVGKPIEAGVGAIAGKDLAKRAVSFRPTGYLGGRSLGDETVNITFDFFCASVGDAWGRDIAGWFDPNVKKDWMDAKGNITFPKAVDAALKSVTRYVTYNGGEDWAVAIPYAFFMKAQRSLINKASPGFKYDFDHQLNGSSFKVQGGLNSFSGAGAPPKIVGNYIKEGMIDLQSRFTVYNIGTMMYREAYDYVGNMLSGKTDRLYGSPDQKDKPNQGVMDKAGNLMKWVARSAIKGVIVMTPAVPFFWITRSTQNRHRGLFISPDQGVIINQKPNGDFASVMANDVQVHKQVAGKPVYYSAFKDGQWSLDPWHGRMPTPDMAMASPAQQKGFHPYKMGDNLVDKAFDKIGMANYRGSQLMDKPAAWADKSLGTFGNRIKSSMEITNFNAFTRRMGNAAISYTPYMYAKAEFANLWDNGKMDMAAERLIDGAVKFNWGEFKAGAGEIWSAFLHKPIADPAREIEAQRRIRVDTTAPDIFTETQAKMDDDRERAMTTWRDHLISGPPSEKKSLEPKSIRPTERKTSFAEQEEMRKALVELNPPTNAIN